jgi:transcriptional regulator with XRE-family HTH domain
MASIFRTLGNQIKRARKERDMSQAQLAQRVGRSVNRVSELERDFTTDRWGRDRLTLFAEICDTLDLGPVLVPRGRLAEVEQLLGRSDAPLPAPGIVTTPFDDLFVDLSDHEDEI